MENPLILTDEQVLAHAEGMFQDWYISKTPMKELRVQVLGLLLSRALTWTPSEIAQASIIALEDSNYHSLVKVMADFIDNDDRL